MQSIKGDEGVREALTGELSFALSDAAIHAWLEGDSTTASKLSDMVSTLQSEAAPEELRWVARLLGFQVASLLRVVQQQQQQQAAQQARAPRTA